MATPQNRIITPRYIIQLLLLVVFIPLLPLLISGRWDWVEGWVYAMVSIVGFAASRILAVKRHPDLLDERARTLQHADTKTWDKFLAPMIGLGGGLIPLVAGLDAPFRWSPTLSYPVKIAALLVILAGWALGSYALIENRFFSGVVGIQSERGHHVVSSGPYRWIRHPGYAGALLSFWASPIYLEALWAFLPALLLTILLLVRTQLEDKTLQEESDGYREYTKRVRYRLLPRVW